MKALILFLVLTLFPATVLGWKAHVQFTAPGDATFVTGVFVTEIEGDYSESFGQLSGPGETFVEIENIKPSTTYYFSARRYDPDGWHASNWSDEVEHTTGINVAPVTVDLPPLMEDQTIVITVEIK